MENKLSLLIYIPFFVICFVIRVYWVKKALRRPVKEDKSFRLDKINISLMNLTLIIFPWIALLTSAFNKFDYPASDAQIILSAPFLISSLVFMWLSHRDLGENWSVTLELKENHALVTQGIFKKIRHPMYLAIWLGVIGQALCIPNYIGGSGALIVWTFLYFLRINKEEQMMIEKFGEEYRTYMSRTKRLVPGVY